MILFLQNVLQQPRMQFSFLFFFLFSKIEDSDQMVYQYLLWGRVSYSRLIFQMTF